MSFLLLFLGIVGIVVNGILAELLYEGLRRAKKNRYEIQWSARHFQPLNIALLWSIFFLLVERNLQLLGSVMFVFDLTTYARWILNNVFSIGFLCSFALRCWLVHYDYHTGVAMYVKVTNISLNPDEAEHFRWFLDNKAFYGSPKYLNTFISLMVLILNVFLVAWLAVSPSTYYVGVVIIYSALMLIVMGVTKKITILDDEFFIRKELLTEFRILAGFFIFSGIIIAFGPVMGWEYAAFFICEGSAATICGMGAIATWWMLDKSEIFTLPILIEEKRREKEREHGDVSKAHSSGVPPIQNVLADKAAVALFLKHLVRELSVENVFFLADVMEYKKSFVQSGKLDEIPGFYTKMPSLLAKFEYNENITFLKYAFAINLSYIDNVSAFYLTCLRDETREYILNELESKQDSKEKEFEKYEFEELATIFDPAAKEVYALIKQAYKRFSQSPDFQGVQLDRNRALTIEMADQLNKRKQNQQKKQEKKQETTTSGGNNLDDEKGDDMDGDDDSSDDKPQRKNSVSSSNGNTNKKPETAPVNTNDDQPTTNETEEEPKETVNDDAPLLGNHESSEEIPSDDDREP